MKQYTIGALFNNDMTKILLIQKVKPEWQAGKLNFPGGKTEEGETPWQCVSREFEEEAGIKVPAKQWHLIGRIENAGEYSVDFLAYIHTAKQPVAVSLTDEKLLWFDVNNLPTNVISNLRWLIPFAINYFRQGNADMLSFGKFEYKY
jgi:mutator protein MutT